MLQLQNFYPFLYLYISSVKPIRWPWRNSKVQEPAMIRWAGRAEKPNPPLIRRVGRNPPKLRRAGRIRKAQAPLRIAELLEYP